MGHDPLQAIHDHLRRVQASGVEITSDPNFDPQAGELALVRLQDAEWRLPPVELENLLKEVPDGAGDEAVRRIIEEQGKAVWHGPAPESSRDTSHRPS